MSNFIKKVLPFLLLIFSTFLLIYLTLPKDESFLPNLKDLKSKMELEGIEVIQGKDGKLEWKLKAKEAKQVKEEIVLNKVVFEYADKKKLIVTSPEGKIKEDNSKIILYPKVSIVREDLKVNCDELIYEQSKEKIDFINNFTMFKDNSFKIKGNKASFDIKNNIFIVEGKVRSIWYY